MPTMRPKPTITDPTSYNPSELGDRIARALREIRQDYMNGFVPAVKSFSALHDHVDANNYVTHHREEISAHCVFENAVSSAVDAILQEGFLSGRLAYCVVGSVRDPDNSSYDDDDYNTFANVTDATRHFVDLRERTNAAIDDLPATQWTIIQLWSYREDLLPDDDSDDETCFWDLSEERGEISLLQEFKARGGW